MPKETELWKRIEELPRYEISNLGRVRSLIGIEKILKPTPDNRGYLRVKLCGKPARKGQYITKDYRLHRLVAKYFCDNYAEEKEVHHKNRQRQDNRAENLICLTKAEHAELHRQIREQEKKDQANAGEITGEKESIEQ